MTGKMTCQVEGLTWSCKAKGEDFKLNTYYQIECTCCLSKTPNGAILTSLKGEDFFSLGPRMYSFITFLYHTMPWISMFGTEWQYHHCRFKVNDIYIFWNKDFFNYSMVSILVWIIHSKYKINSFSLSPKVVNFSSYKAYQLPN